MEAVEPLLWPLEPVLPRVDPVEEPELEVALLLELPLVEVVPAPLLVELVAPPVLPVVVLVLVLVLELTPPLLDEVELEEADPVEPLLLADDDDPLWPVVELAVAELAVPLVEVELEPLLALAPLLPLVAPLLPVTDEEALEVVGPAVVPPAVPPGWADPSQPQTSANDSANAPHRMDTDCPLWQSSSRAPALYPTC